MKAITIQQFGFPPILRIKTGHEPVTMTEEALVGVQAIAISQVDKQILQGIRPATAPLVAGVNIAGIVSAIETYFADTEGYPWAEGDRVVVNPIKIVNGVPQIFGLHTPGGYAEYIDVPFENLYKLPDIISFSVAALAIAEWTDTHLTPNLSDSDLITLFHRFPKDMDIVFNQPQTDELATILGPENFLEYINESEIEDKMIVRWR